MTLQDLLMSLIRHFILLYRMVNLCKYVIMDFIVTDDSGRRIGRRERKGGYRKVWIEDG